MKPRRPKPEYAVASAALAYVEEFKYPAVDQYIPPGVPGGKGGTPTVVVAASDASEMSKGKADFVCTGAADNLVIQDALNILDAANGGTLWLTEGDYFFDATTATDCTFLFSCNATIRGMGRPGTLSNNRCTRIFVENTDAATRGFAGGSEYFMIRDLGFFGEDVDGSTAIAIGGGRVSNVYVQGFGVGVEMDYGRVDNSFIALCEYDIFCDQQVTIDNNFLSARSGFDAYAIGGFVAAGSMIVKNVIGDPGLGGLDGDFLGGIFLDQAADQTLIAGNSFYIEAGNPAIALWLNGAYGCTIVDNHFYLERCDGIVLDDSVNVVRDNIVARNYVNMEFPQTDNTYDAIRIEGDTNMIHHNLLRGSATATQPRYGINIASGDDNIVVGNDYGQLTDWSTSVPFNDAGTGTRIVYPNDATYGDNFTL